MSDENLLTRREFTVETALAMLAGVTITISGCGDDDDDNPTNPTNTTPPAADRTGTVGTNHGHVATITAAQLTAGMALTLNIQGTAPHPHTVSLTQTDVTEISGGRRVDKVSSTDQAHSHTVTFN
jgi:hypothetical protein